jgi:hypothetical protein
VSQPNHTNCPGITVERRALLVLTGAGAFLLGSRGVHAEPAADYSYDEYIRTVPDELMKLLPATTESQFDEFVWTAGAKLRRVGTIPFPQGMKETGLDIRPISKFRAVFSVIAYRAAPGVVQPPHDHPKYSVATMGLEGAVRVRYFEPDGEAPPHSSREPFRVRKTAERWLEPRSVMTLTPTRDNIHTFEAGPDGARWVDFNTAHAPDDFSYLRLMPCTSERTGDLFDAKWGLSDDVKT